jgi:hypothetical protein
MYSFAFYVYIDIYIRKAIFAYYLSLSPSFIGIFFFYFSSSVAVCFGGLVACLFIALYIAWVICCPSCLVLSFGGEFAFEGIWGTNRRG